MFKVIMLVKKRAELGTEEFLACWREHSAKVLERVHSLHLCCKLSA